MSYGYRRMAETVFSSIKRTFGEHVTARKFPYMVKEIFLKAALYNVFNLMSLLTVCCLYNLHTLKPLMNHATQQILQFSVREHVSSTTGTFHCIEDVEFVG
jgi:hypothetical protein